MILDIPASSANAVSKQLIRLSKNGDTNDGARVLTLIINATDQDDTEQVILHASQAARLHPCRVIILITGNPNTTSHLDAQIRCGNDAGVSEIVIFRLFGALAEQAASVAIPFLLPDTPIVAWWPGVPPVNPSADPIGYLASRRITDVSQVPDPHLALQSLSQNYSPGDTDLNWTRITYIRGLLVSALDQPPYAAPRNVIVSGKAQDMGVDLFAAWIKAQANIAVTRRVSETFTITVDRENYPITITVHQSHISITIAGQPDGRVANLPRDTAGYLSQELQRLGPDPIYHKTLSALTEIEYITHSTQVS